MLCTIVYMSCLVCAIGWCYRQDVPIQRMVASLGCIAVTWFYIIRYMVNYEGPNAFDGAYADVIWGGSEGNWAYTQALLTWAIVAMVWSHEACIAYQIFGVFGAMSASFLVYRPPTGKREATIPVAYALCAAIGVLCTLKLPGTSTLEDLAWWLYGLHAALLVPKVLPFGSVDKLTLYAFLALCCFASHVSAGRSPLPNTDCKISITVDLLVVTIVTLLHIWNSSKSLLGTLFAALLAMAFSPGFVLASYEALEFGLHRRLVTWAQASVAAKLGSPNSLRNLGFWKDLDPCEQRSYGLACQALSDLVGRACVKKGDRVLCAGCGGPSEVKYFKGALDPSFVVGVDGDPSVFSEEKEAPVLTANLEELADLSITGLRHGAVNKVLAVDSAYHSDKAAFFQQVAKLLAVDGQMALTDVILKENAPMWVRFVLQAMNIPWKNHWTRDDYENKLASQGFELDKWESLEPYVLHMWLPEMLRVHLDYVLIKATLKKKAHRRPTCAIVGSGMSGCLTARLLSETHEVTVFEAGAFVNFAGRAIQVDDVTVDVPLRMIAPHYYHEMVQTIHELQVVKTTPTRFDACFYNKVKTLFITQVDMWSSFSERLKYLGTLFRLTIAVFFFEPSETMTLKEFAEQHNVRDTEVYQIFILPQLSWMLSCDLAMVEAYPASVVCGFLRAINPLVSFTKGIVRIDPCNKVLQDALVKGIDVKVNTPVNSIGKDLSILGEKYDVVVIATEAGAVPKILKDRDWAQVFAEFKYHPSSVILHRDPSLMPANPEEWRVLNVAVDAKEPACMLTVWMNAYYGGEGSNTMGPFKDHVLQTWNPHVRPKDDSIIQESHFTRVIHDSDSPRLFKAVADLQGKEGIYFVGAYSVPGLGLLEQATSSARHVASLIQQEVAQKSQ